MNKDSTAYKAILLAILCAICGLLLSGVNAVTAPIIAKNRLATELASLEQIYPGADFEPVDDFDDPSGLIQGVYRSPGNGTIYKIHNVGYNSNGFTFMVAFNEDGTVGGFLPIEQSETDGFGARCFEPDYTATINSLTSSDPVPLLSGATLTSTAIQQGIDAAKALFNADAGISYDPNAVADTPTPAPGQKFSFTEDFSDTKPETEEVSNDGTTAVFHTKAGGFSFLNGGGDKNEAEITLDVPSGSVKSVKVTKFADTPDIGDKVTTDDFLKTFEGLKDGDSVDAVSGATFTSRSIIAMVKDALNALKGGGGETAAVPAGADTRFAETEPEVEEVSNDGTTAVYRIKTGGFSFLNGGGDKNTGTVEIDVPTGTVKSITLDNFSDTPDVGDKATTDDYLKKFVGVSDADDVDGVSGATFTTKSVKSMIQSALDKFRSAGNGETAEAVPAEEKPAETAAAPADTDTRFAETEPEVEEVSNDGTTAVYRIKTGGFSFLNGGGDKNTGTVEIDVPTGTVKSITLDNFSDTPDVGDKATTDDYLKKFVGVSDADDVDGVSGATFTTKSVKSMIQSALDKFRSAGGETAAAAPAEEKPAETAAPAEKPAEKPAETASVTRFKETEPETEEVSNDGTKAVFRVKSGGFSFLNEKGDKNEGEVEIDPKTGKVSKFTVTKFADTPNVGDKATADDYLKKFVGVSDADDVDGVSGATFTTNSVKAMVQSALDQFAKSAKPVETLPSTEVGK